MMKRNLKVKQSGWLSVVAIAFCAVGYFYTPPAYATDHTSKGGATTAARQSITVDAPQQGADRPNRTRFETFQGTGSFINKPKQAAGTAPSAGDINLDFADTDIHDLVRATLGDILHLSYTIDPQISGRITLRTGSPISKSEVLHVVEVALQLNGLTIIHTGDTYSVQRLSDVQSRDRQVIYEPGKTPAPGYGVEVVPLHYIAAQKMQSLLQPLGPQGATIRIDRSRNFIFITGTEPERDEMKKNVALFDVDYLRSMSFALVRPAYVDASTLAAELDKLFEGEGSPMSGVVRLIPIPRINAVMVMTSRASYLPEVKAWVERLDIAPTMTSGKQIYFLRLQNVQAADARHTLARLFGGGIQPLELLSPTAHQPTLPSARNLTSLSGTTNAAVPPSVAAARTPGSITPSQAWSGGAEASTGPQIVADDANNALIIRATPAEYAAIERIVRKMDVAPDQVLIEATIVEVTLNDQLKYGVQWTFNGRSGIVTFSPSSSGTPTQIFPGLSYLFSNGAGNIKAALNALSAVTTVRVLSAPRILTLNNRSATLEVGDQVPIVTQTAVSTNAADAPLVSTIQMKSTGIILAVTPRIGASGTVFLDISQEVSDVIPTSTSNIDSPTIQERKIQTTVAAHDGETVALGGLIKHSESVGDTGIPVLKDIPVLGTLFKSSGDQHDRTELIVFLTPRVIRSPEDAQAMTDALAQRLDDLKPEMTKMLHGHHGG